jgi:hypothetical protein
MKGFKKGYALSPLLFTFALEYAIMGVQVKQNGTKLNDTHQLLLYADDEKRLAGSIHNKKELQKFC